MTASTILAAGPTSAEAIVSVLCILSGLGLILMILAGGHKGRKK